MTTPVTGVGNPSSVARRLISVPCSPAPSMRIPMPRRRCPEEPGLSDSILAGTTGMLQLSPSFHPVPGQQRGYSEEDLPHPLRQRQRQGDLAIDAEQGPESHETGFLYAQPR